MQRYFFVKTTNITMETQRNPMELIIVNGFRWAPSICVSKWIGGSVPLFREQNKGTELPNSSVDVGWCQTAEDSTDGILCWFFSAVCGWNLLTSNCKSGKSTAFRPHLNIPLMSELRPQDPDIPSGLLNQAKISIGFYSVNLWEVQVLQP